MSLGRQLEELTQVVIRFTSASPINPLQNTSKTVLSELNNEVETDSSLEPLKGNPNATEDLSELTSETSFESLQEAPTIGLRESTDELLPQSPIEVSERRTQNSSEASSDSPIVSLQDTSKIGLSELNNELKTDSPLDPLRGNPDATEELSESDSETVF